MFFILLPCPPSRGRWWCGFTWVSSVTPHHPVRIVCQLTLMGATQVSSHTLHFTDEGKHLTTVTHCLTGTQASDCTPQGLPFFLCPDWLIPSLPRPAPPPARPAPPRPCPALPRPCPTPLPPPLPLPRPAPAPSFRVRMA